MYALHTLLILIVISTGNAHVAVEFRAYKNGDLEHYHQVDVANYGSLVFTPAHNYIILCHGWRSPTIIPWYNETIRAFGSHPNYVVIGAYYQQAVIDPLYIPAVMQAPEIGQRVGAFILGLHQAMHIPFGRIEIVGHSMGAHIAGIAGDFIRLQTGGNGRIHRIFALDPAALGFRFMQRRLTVGDASKVIVFHTSTYGLDTPIGDVDFFPNGGRSQGACGRLHRSDHAAANYYFYCSVDGRCANWAKRCDGYANFLGGRCANAPSALMGYWLVDHAALGKYYLTVQCV